MFLVVTNKRDVTSDFVVLELQRRSLPYLRLNTEDLPKALLDCRPATGGAWRIAIDGKDVDLANVGAAYFRRPETPEPLADVRTPEERTYCSAEWSAALHALYWELDLKWLNAPHKISVAENKIRQLREAHAVGFKVPETLVTNDAAAAEAFAATADIVGKPLRNAVVGNNESDRVIFTKRLTADAFSDPMPTRVCPLILQREIPKRFDLRVTVVGDELFAVTIDSQAHTQTQVDWRSGSRPDLSHEVHSLPVDISRKCFEIVKRLGLRFGAIDLVLDTRGDYWFLEVNPNGQWGWIEKRTGLPISRAIVRELERIAHETLAADLAEHRAAETC